MPVACSLVLNELCGAQSASSGLTMAAHAGEMGCLTARTSPMLLQYRHTEAVLRDRNYNGVSR